MESKIKVGDLVAPASWTTNLSHIRSMEYGVVIDYFEDDSGLVHVEVQWQDHKEWWSPFELEIISESR